MASTFSPSLRIELIGDGDQSGIWGQTTNTNLGTLIEQAISGVVSITMVDANYTLTNFNGVSDEARNQVIVLTGTNNAQRNLIAPLVEKTYVVKNSTTGGFAVQIIGASGTGVIIPNGMTTTVYCDGVNFYTANSGASGNFAVAGNLSVTGTTALTGATALSAALTYGGVTLANSVTGTGSMALSASPTFTGVPAAPNANVTTVSTQIATTAFVRDIIPAGVILLWSGSLANIPLGWVLCNGSSGTPDLRDRFIVGAGNGYAVGATGGQTDATLVAHTHTINDPTHAHVMDRFLGSLGGFNTAYVGDNSGAGPASPGSTQGASTGITINSTGSPATNANLPPYYALAYIMKT